MEAHVTHRQRAEQCPSPNNHEFVRAINDKKRDLLLLIIEWFHIECMVNLPNYTRLNSKSSQMRSPQEAGQRFRFIGNWFSPATVGFTETESNSPWRM